MKDPHVEGHVAVSIIVVARERFGEAVASLDDMLKQGSPSVELVYVSGRSPRHVLDAIDGRAQDRKFRHIKLDRLLSPNEARNIGVRAARGQFVVFVDNDVFGAQGWLQALVDCAEESGADIVTPLTCHGPQLHAVVHQAGGEFAPDPDAFFAQPQGQREIVEVMNHQNDKVADLSLQRSETQLCEFHCVLVRKSVFDKVGPLDEGLMATKEHLDFCMAVRSAGGKVLFEPRSVVTYLFPNKSSPISISDWPFFLVRWSPEWQRRSLSRFQEKWGLKDTGYLTMRAGMLSWRHDEGIIKGSLRRLPVVGRQRIFLAAGRRLLSPLVRGASRALVAWEDRKRSRPSATGALLTERQPSA